MLKVKKVAELLLKLCPYSLRHWRSVTNSQKRHGSLENTIQRPPEGFPGGAVVKNPLANAGDTDLSPGPGESHMPQSN